MFLYVLGDAGDRVHCRNAAHQSILFGISHWLFLLPVARSGAPHQATQETKEAVSYAP